MKTLLDVKYCVDRALSSAEGKGRVTRLFTEKTVELA